MLKAFLNGLDVTEHHGCAGVESDFVGAFHDLEPFVGIALERRDSGANPVNEDFSTAPRNGAETGRLELAKHIRHGHSEHLGEVLELGRGESVHVNPRKTGSNVAQHFQVVFDAEAGMVAALEENLDATDAVEFGKFFPDLLVRQDVVVVVLLCSIKRAKLTVNVADVGVVHVSVDDVGHDGVSRSVVRLSFQLVSSGGCERSELWHGEVVQGERVLLRNAFAGDDAVRRAACFGSGSDLHASVVSMGLVAGGGQSRVPRRAGLERLFFAVDEG